MLAPIRKGEVMSVGTVMKGEGRVSAPVMKRKKKSVGTGSEGGREEWQH
jgi:hypothetical protein